jgi:hypothetical protein
MSKRAVDSVFQAMFLLTDLRMILRSTAPGHDLDPDQHAEAEKLIRALEEQVSVLRQELLK